MVEISLLQKIYYKICQNTFISIRTGMRVTGPALIIESVCSKQQQSRFCKIQLRVITRNFDSFKWQTYK